MQVIFSRFFRFRTDADIRAYLAMYKSYQDDAAAGNDTLNIMDNDFISEDLDDVIIGNIRIFGIIGDESVEIGLREDFEGAVVDGKPFALHGSAFRRFHCVRTQDRYEAQAQRLRDEAAIRYLRIDERAASEKEQVDDWLARKLERLDLEFRIDQGDPRYALTATEETATEETTDETAEEA